MATPEQTPYNTYLGNGVTTEFSIGFNYTDTGSVKVYIKRSGGEEELLPDTDYSFVNETTLKFPAVGSSETVLADGDVLTIQRETAVENDFVFSNQKRLFPEDVMEADDNEMRILQEHARQLGRALVLPPTSQVDPGDVIGQVERVYDSIDNIDAVADDISNVNAVADDIINVNAVAGNATNINAVNANKTNINAVADDISNVNAVAGNATNINAVNANKTNINAVAGNATNINAVAGNATNINAVNANKTNIDTVASNISKVNNVSTNMAKVTGVYDNMSTISAVNSNKTNIDTVAGDKSNIDSVANKISNVNTVAGSISNVNTVATNISNVNTCASNMSAITSAPTYAANAAASAELSAQYANDKINQTHITNCITEIHQDIKLELNNGTLTLKAGSKVYVPNGSGVFDSVSIVNDISLSGVIGSANTMILICVSADGSSMFTRPLSNCVSGAGATTASGFAFDTTANKINWYNSGGVKQVGDYSLPICIIQSDANGSISLVEQVFNGFGYIGSTVFVLPGIKGLIPNGRNEDGTLKNILLTLGNVRANTFTSNKENENFVVATSGNGVSADYVYDEEKNSINQGSTVFNDRFIAGTLTVSGGKVTEFSTKTPFHALDYNDKGTIAGWSMPGNKYIDLTLGADGTKYTAPANGFFCAVVTGGNTSYFVRLINTAIDNVRFTASSGGQTNGNPTVIIPAKKGDEIKLNYSGTMIALSFVYAEGEI